MKILLVNDYGTPTGGAELMTLALRDGLRERGIDARLFSTTARPGAATSQADYACLGTTSRLRTLLQTANPWAYRSLRRVLAEFQPDVVHVRIFLTQLSPLILPLLREVPSLYHVAWYRPVCPRGTKKLPGGVPCDVRWGLPCYRNGCLPQRDWLPLMIQMKLWQRWRAAFKLIVVESLSLKECLAAEGLGPLQVIPPGVPVGPQRPLLEPPPAIAFAGRLAPEKGVDLLLRAFAAVVRDIPEAQLLLAGDGPQRPELEALAADLGLSAKVSMPGHLPRLEVERFLAPAWVQAVPSQWAEPFGLVAPEAMMRGTAVVASASGGLAEVVQDGVTGYLVPPGDTQALAQALLRLLRDRSLAEEMGQAARREALARFDETSCVERFSQVYQTLCHG